jgi:putative redox protein
MTLKISVNAMAGERYAQVIEAGRHTLMADRPVLRGGADQGPGPYAYLLSALGA